ncbi:MAG: IS630 transposase-related protein [Planctomycetota bacterium]|jgi:transposase
MAKPYPQELRDRVLAAYDRGMKTHQIAEVFQVSPAWARRLKQRRRESGETAPRPMGGATVVKIDMDRLRQLVEAQPDATIKELRHRLGADCGESAVGMALKRLGLSFKKRRSMRPSKTAPTSSNAGNAGNATNPDATRAA